MSIFDCYEFTFIFCLFFMCLYLLSKFNKHQRQILLLGNAVVTIGDIISDQLKRGIDADVEKAQEFLDKIGVPKLPKDQQETKDSIDSSKILL